MDRRPCCAQSEAQHESKLTPLFGRDDEIELLLRRWRNATQGEGRIVVLTGDPGIGKSHIALALQKRLQAEPHISLRYFCSAHHINSALFRSSANLNGLQGSSAAICPPRSSPSSKCLLAPSAVDRSQTVALLADLLSLPPSDRYRLPELSPQSRKEKTLAALLSQLEGLATAQPVLVIFEDVHWIDPTSLELLTITVERGYSFGCCSSSPSRGLMRRPLCQNPAGEAGGHQTICVVTIEWQFLDCDAFASKNSLSGWSNCRSMVSSSH